jgi:hypothetical protein
MGFDKSWALSREKGEALNEALTGLWGTLVSWPARSDDSAQSAYTPSIT